MIAVAVASEALMAKLDANKADLAKLADPRTINMDDALADEIARRAAPVYYITGTIHSTEAGAPTALMELAYRLAVDDSPYIRNIREHVITLITPVVEVDGRDRVVDIYEWKKKHPNDTVPAAIYWGHYVAHDNNRDAMGLTLKLSQNVLDTYLGLEGAGAARPARVGRVPVRQHDRRRPLQRVARSDPHQRVADDRLEQRQRDDAHGHARRLRVRHVRHVVARLPDVHGGDAQRHQPPVRNVRQRRQRRHAGAHARRQRHVAHLVPAEPAAPAREVVAPQQQQLRADGTARLAQLHREQPALLPQQLLREEQAVDSEGEDRRARRRTCCRRAIRGSGSQAELLRVLQKQAVEISRATAAFSVTVPVKRAASNAGGRRGGEAGLEGPGWQGGGKRQEGRRWAGAGRAGGRGNDERPAPPRPVQTETKTFPAGSYIVRMDQPYSRIADALLDYQYWAPNDPQKTPYDDTGWTFPEGFGVQAVRVTDAKVLDAPMEPVKGDVKAAGGVTGEGSIFAINHNADNALITLRYKLKDADFQAAEEPFDAAGGSSTAARSSSRVWPQPTSRKPQPISASRRTRWRRRRR